jgi:hypothetical protein
MRSENAGEDVDKNGKTGETFTAQVSVSGALGVYKGAAFNTSVENLVVGSGSPNCRPAACNCPDLGDVVANFETPRLCQVTIHRGTSGQIAGDAGTSDAGDPLANAEVQARLSGTEVPPAAAASICAGQSCNAGKLDAGGNVTIQVPVLGDAPQIDISSDVNTGTDFYSGRASVAGCTRTETTVAGTVELSYTHTSLSFVADFIATLGSGPQDAGLKDTAKQLEEAAKDCGCRTVAPRRVGTGDAALLLFGLALGCGRRRRSAR